MKLEDMMFKDGWKQSRTFNAGQVYITWHKEGFSIDDNEIVVGEKE